MSGIVSQGCIEAAAVAYMVERMRHRHASGRETDPPDAADYVLEFAHAVGAGMADLCHHEHITLVHRGGGRYRIECDVDRKHGDCDEHTDWYGDPEAARSAWAERKRMDMPF